MQAAREFVLLSFLVLSFLFLRWHEGKARTKILRGLSILPLVYFLSQKQVVIGVYTDSERLLARRSESVPDCLHFQQSTVRFYIPLKVLIRIEGNCALYGG